MDAMLKVRVDFNAMTKDGEKVIIGPDLKGVTLSPGERIIIYEPYDFEVEAIVECEIEEKYNQKWWYAVPDWSTLRDLPTTD
jgi:hypothetical protein